MFNNLIPLFPFPANSLIQLWNLSLSKIREQLSQGLSQLFWFICLCTRKYHRTFTYSYLNWTLGHWQTKVVEVYLIHCCAFSMKEGGVVYVIKVGGCCFIVLCFLLRFSSWLWWSESSNEISTAYSLRSSYKHHSSEVGIHHHHHYQYFY